MARHYDPMAIVGGTGGLSVAECTARVWCKIRTGHHTSRRRSFNRKEDRDDHHISVRS